MKQKTMQPITQSGHPAPIKLLSNCSVTISAFALILTGCGQPSSDAAVQQKYNDLHQQHKSLQVQVEALIAERNALRLKLEELSTTPAALLDNVRSTLQDASMERAQAAFSALIKKFPDSLESLDGKRLLTAKRDKLNAELAEARRVEALGFKALKVPGMLDAGDLTAKFGNLTFGSRFTFDRYDSSYHYRDADRETKFALVSMTVTAAKGINNPDLSGIALYWVDGAELKKVGDFAIEFSRWEDYATYLGNYSDSRNDFAKSQRIPFDLGLQGANELMAKRPLYLVSTQNGCITRGYERFKNPPVFYTGVCKELNQTLTLNSFTAADSKLVVVKRFD